MFDSHKIDAFFNGDKPFDNNQTENKPKTSVWLRFVKLGFPCVAAAILGVMVVLPNIKKSVDLRDNITMPRKNEMEKLHMEQTVYTATDNKNRVNTVTADSVDEVAPGSKEMKLQNPRGEIPADKGNIHIRADVGFFNQNNNILMLKDNVYAEDENGASVHTSQAFYDFEAERGYGNEKVYASGEWGTIEAAGFEYLKKEEVLVLTGNHTITTKDGVLSAEQETRWYQKENKTESVGKARVIQDKNTLYADKIVGYFNGKSKKEIEKIEAFGNVFVKTPKGTAAGDRGVYNPKTEKVNLYGNVRLEQNGNFINGSEAQTDLKTSISRITADKKKGGRITGTFYNKRK